MHFLAGKVDDRLRKKLGAFLPPEQAEIIADCINRNRHGVIEGRVNGEIGLFGVEMKIQWSTTGGEKRIDLWGNGFVAANERLDLKIAVPGMPEWREKRKHVYSALAPEILFRHKQFLARHFVKCYGLDLRLREGKDRWGEPLAGFQLIGRDDRLQAIVVTAGDQPYLVTKSGTFPVRTSLLVTVEQCLQSLFGFSGKQFRKPESLIREIERQLTLREEAERILGYVPHGRIKEVDPRCGVMVGKYFYPIPRTRRVKIRLGPDIRTIAELMYGIYGDAIPENPDVAADYTAPPWTLRRFGEKRKAYLIEEDPARDLYVFLEDFRFHLGFGKKTFRFVPRKYRPGVAEAFRAVFGVDLTPEMTREDVEAVVAMTALG